MLLFLRPYRTRHLSRRYRKKTLNPCTMLMVSPQILERLSSEAPTEVEQPTTKAQCVLYVGNVGVRTFATHCAEC